MANSEHTTEERRASWTELFFDLVAVAGIGQLTHLLHRGPSLGEFGLYVVLYLAFWVVWACVTVYSNVAGEQARTTMVFGCMFGLCVMMAAVDGLPGEHAAVFAGIYVLVRIVSGMVWRRGQVVVDWPIAQIGAGTVPWVVSLWVPAPWKFVLWAVGLAIDLWIMFAVDGERRMVDAERRMRARLRRGRAPRGHPRFTPPKLQALHADSPHLGERLGQFLIIVLGEGVISVIAAVSTEDWTVPVAVIGVCAFLSLLAMWALTLRFGFVPRMMEQTDAASPLPLPRLMAMHCTLSAAVATVAAGLGLVAAHPSGHLPVGVGWVLCGGAAAYFLVCGLGGAVGAGFRWLLRWPLPCFLAALGLAAASPHLGGLWTVVGVTVVLIASVVSETTRMRSR
ncbi:low temperature requirement protein A [Nocardia caishijiensis]|uniref:Low temperature requirement protein LtrA n=1 Tax=Nocardia caishijiensis TaxID=184756 RepID=A0ABQ6YMW0_9NOCA|nr:low temperature requirement protein A [Nocardia caishijiensis]KAF0847137.1 low temperature requirement protein LtrA [Nocardia caishijiensis]